MMGSVILAAAVLTVWFFLARRLADSEPVAGAPQPAGDALWAELVQSSDSALWTFAPL